VTSPSDFMRLINSAAVLTGTAPSIRRTRQ
jgi:hypothetical protein